MRKLLVLAALLVPFAFIGSAGYNEVSSLANNNMTHNEASAPVVNLPVQTPVEPIQAAPTPETSSTAAAPASDGSVDTPVAPTDNAQPTDSLNNYVPLTTDSNGFEHAN